MAGAEIPNHPKMDRVMPLLLQLEKNTNDYLPLAVSFGPHHHGETKLALMEAFKPTAVDMFTSGGRESKEFYYHKILAIIDDLRSCYVQTSIAKYTEDELAQMLLHDAALFIILMEFGVGKFTIFDKMKSDLGILTIGVLLRDMYLFDNQIPLRVIKVLVDERDGAAGRGDELVHRFSIWSLYGEYREEALQQEVDDDEPHLLHVIRRLIISGIGKPKTTPPTKNRETKTGCVDLENGLGLRKLFCCKSAAAADNDSLKRFIPVYRAATDLKAKGIYFKPSPTESLSDVTFKYHFLYARLCIPAFTVDSETKVFIKNMIAYELSPSGPVITGEIASFVNFIKSLIEKAEDVKELREKKILCNNLGSDEEALDVLKDINTHGADDLSIYKIVRDEIGAHCDSKMKTWIAELLHTNFKSPWTMAAFLAAVVLLAVTVAQLYYAIHPK